MHTFNSDHSLTLTWIQMQQATARITEFNDSMGARSLLVQKFYDLKEHFFKSQSFPLEHFWDAGTNFRENSRANVTAVI